MLPESAQTDYLFKLINGKARGSSSFKVYEESIAGYLDIHAADVYADSIPTTPPGATTDTIKIWSDATGGDGRIILTCDKKYSGNKVWVAKSTFSNNFNSGIDEIDLLTDFISPKYGNEYTVRVYDGNDVEIPLLDSSNWCFNYKSGVLTFDVSRSEDGSNDTTEAIKIDVYQYIGNFLDSTKPYAFTYADQATRIADSNFTQNDLYKLALQEDDGTIWILTNYYPVTWKRVSDPETMVQLTDGPTIDIDARKGNKFTVTLGGDRTLMAPTNGYDGQHILVRVKQDGVGNRQLSLDAGTNDGYYRFGNDIPSIILSTGANAVDYISFIYDESSSAWDVVGYQTGF